METLNVMTSSSADVLEISKTAGKKMAKGVSVEEAYRIICDDIKAIYNEK